MNVALLDAITSSIPAISSGSANLRVHISVRVVYEEREDVPAKGSTLFPYFHPVVRSRRTDRHVRRNVSTFPSVLVPKQERWKGNVPGGKDIDPHSLVRPFSRQTLSKHGQPRFARIVRALRLRQVVDDPTHARNEENQFLFSLAGDVSGEPRLVGRSSEVEGREGVDLESLDEVRVGAVLFP